MLVKQNEVILYAELRTSEPDVSSIVWFDDKDSILVFKNLPHKEHRFEYSIIDSGEAALREIWLMKMNEWEIHDERLELIIQRLRP